VAVNSELLGAGEFALDASLLALHCDRSKSAFKLGSSAADRWKSANFHV
jgi:hypothetical protein